MDNFALRRTDAAPILGPDPDGLVRPVGIANRRDVGYRVGRTPSVLESAAVRKAASEPGLPPPALNYRKHGEDQLSGETDRTGRRAVTGKLIHERSTKTRHPCTPQPTSARGRRSSPSMISRDRSPYIEPIHAPAADEPTHGEHHRDFPNDSSRLTRARREQQNENGPEHKAD
jgi:hypothetical protein